MNHVGGLWTWVEFPNSEACMASKQTINLKNMFATIKPVTKSFIVDVRMIWIENDGFLLCVWGSG